MTIRFESLGLYLPERTETTADIVSRLKIQTPFDLSKITGIERRHVSEDSESTLSLALNAARDCLQNSKYNAEDLDCIISCSISRRIDSKYHFEPTMSILIKNDLGAQQAMNFDISNACAGMLTGVYILDSLIRSGAVQNGMVLSGERNYAGSETAEREIDSIFHEQFASLTVGDAATAVILDDCGTEDETLSMVELMTCAEPADLCLGMPSLETPGVALYTKNIKLHAATNLQLWPYMAKKVFADVGSSLEEEHFDYLIPHQIGTRFSQKSAEVVQKVLGFDLPEMLHSLEDCGNTSSTSHFVVLYQALQQGLVHKGTKLLLVPAASGVVTGCVSVTLGDLKVSA